MSKGLNFLAAGNIPAFLLVLAMILVPGKTLIAQLKTHPVEALDSLQQVSPRPVVCFIYGDWCKYCHMMKEESFQDEGITKSINENFHFVQFNADRQSNVRFIDKDFQFIPGGRDTGHHEFVKELATREGQVTTPALIFLDSESRVFFRHFGYTSATDLKVLLTQILTDLKLD